MYGEGATYHSIEHKFRHYRKLAERLRAEAMEGESDNYTSSSRRRQSNKSAPSSKKSTKTTKVDDGPTTPTQIKKSLTSPEPKLEVIAVPKAELIIIESDPDSDYSPIKQEIKVENELTRSRLGIRKRLYESSEDETPQKRLAQASSSLPTALPMLPTSNPRVDSQSNGYTSSSTAGRSTAVTRGTPSPATNARKINLFEFVPDEA